MKKAEKQEDSNDLPIFLLLCFLIFTVLLYSSAPGFAESHSAD